MGTGISHWGRWLWTSPTPGLHTAQTRCPALQEHSEKIWSSCFVSFFSFFCIFSTIHGQEESHSSSCWRLNGWANGWIHCQPISVLWLSFLQIKWCHLQCSISADFWFKLDIRPYVIQQLSVFRDRRHAWYVTHLPPKDWKLGKIGPPPYLSPPFFLTASNKANTELSQHVFWD